MTVYPTDEAECERVLTELGDVLNSRPGPYILCDLHRRDGPLPVRYGAFADRCCVSADGVVEQAVADPSGTPGDRRARPRLPAAGGGGPARLPRVKEARHHAGPTPDGADAVTRLRPEREALERLRGPACVPALRDHFELGGHHFVVENPTEGKPLHQLIVERIPLAAPAPDPAAFADENQPLVELPELANIERQFDS
ncbi:hypothetical protein ACFZCL_35520 [Streptomyces sp. NPDC008159]|uniref:class III lanthionine synthetase LanKC N-terminal domain-containing protein n=1 Tax=Streptomyces sp. NPDC008159 TaxID=3364817 RepID=UPI0036E1AF01